jgi:hypothetical protein
VTRTIWFFGREEALGSDSGCWQRVLSLASSDREAGIGKLAPGQNVTMDDRQIATPDKAITPAERDRCHSPPEAYQCTRL